MIHIKTFRIPILLDIIKLRMFNTHYNSYELNNIRLSIRNNIPVNCLLKSKDKYIKPIWQYSNYLDIKTSKYIYNMYMDKFRRIYSLLKEGSDNIKDIDIYYLLPRDIIKPEYSSSLLYSELYTLPVIIINNILLPGIPSNDFNIINKIIHILLDIPDDININDYLINFTLFDNPNNTNILFNPYMYINIKSKIESDKYKDVLVDYFDLQSDLKFYNKHYFLGEFHLVYNHIKKPKFDSYIENMMDCPDPYIKHITIVPEDILYDTIRYIMINYFDGYDSISNEYIKDIILPEICKDANTVTYGHLEYVLYTKLLNSTSSFNNLVIPINIPEEESYEKC